MKKKLKNSLIVFGSCAFLMFLVYCQFNRKSYYAKVPLTRAEQGGLLTEICIQDKLYRVLLGLNSKFALELDPSVLAPLDKQQSDPVSWKDLNANVFHCDSFTLPSINIAHKAFGPVQTVMKDDLPSGIVGKIGRALLSKQNLFLDLIHHSMSFVDNFKDLKRLGYDLEDFIRVPIKMERIGIVVEASTALGIKKFLMDVSQDHSYLKTEQVFAKGDVEGKASVLSPRFILNGCDFGCLRFFPIEITPELSEIDGVIGLNFLEDHFLFIDYYQSALYISKPGARIKVNFSKR